MLLHMRRFFPSGSPVGARAVRSGWVGLYGRPGVGGCGLCIDEPMSSGDPQRATIKVHLPSTQPPSPLRESLRLMPWWAFMITRRPPQARKSSLFEERPYSTNSYAPISHPTPCGRLTPRWSVEISLIRQSLGGIRSMATLPGSKAWVWVDPLLSLNTGYIPRAEG